MTETEKLADVIVAVVRMATAPLEKRIAELETQLKTIQSKSAR